MSFVYRCSNCNAPATKQPCIRAEGAKATLGSWNCTAKCKRGKVKVKREKKVSAKNA